MSVTLRRLDVAALDRLGGAILDIERELFGSEAWSLALFESELEQAPSRYYVVAQDDDGVVGYGGLCAYPDDAWVQTLAVRRDRWGGGVGAAVLAALLAEAERRGLPLVGLEVRADNVRAQQLYRRFGFAPVGRRRGYYQPSNVDAVVMQRPVTAAR